jgi:hypothetical protein
VRERHEQRRGRVEPLREVRRRLGELERRARRRGARRLGGVEQVRSDAPERVLDGAGQLDRELGRDARVRRRPGGAPRSGMGSVGALGCGRIENGVAFPARSGRT